VWDDAGAHPGYGSRGVGRGVRGMHGARLEVELVVDEEARLATCSADVKKGGLLVTSDAAKLPIR